jgi:phospholipid/cholesterol/gamma-HCH transport system permease protein
MLLSLAPVRATGRGALKAVTAVGRAGYLGRDAVVALRKVGLWGPHLLGQMARIGVESVPIALFIAAFTGVVMALQASYTFTGAVPEYFVGALVGKTMILELGPVLTGLALFRARGGEHRSRDRHDARD